MHNRFPNSQDASAHLKGAIKDLLDDGWGTRVNGKNNVEVFPIDKDPDAPGSLVPKPSNDPDRPDLVASAAAVPAGYTGDVSDCCGAVLQQAGTCQVCTACGKTTGCS